MKDNDVKRRHMILQGNLWQVILILSVPVVINNFVQSVYNFIDVLFVANIGSKEVAAISFVSPINNLILRVGMGFAIAGTTLIAREIGREDYDRAKLISVQLINFCLMLGSILLIVGFFFSKEILIMMSATDELVSIANLYFKINILSIVFVFINTVYFAIKRARGATLETMIVNTMSVIIKVICSAIFINVMKKGLVGLAVSTIIATMFVSIYAVYDLFIKETNFRLSLKKFRFNKKIISSIFIIGFPLMIEKSSVSYSFIMINKYVLGYGESVLAAYGITNRINSLAFSSVMGFGTAVAVIIGQNLGAKQSKRAKDAVTKTFIIAIITSIVIISVILVLRYNIAGLFSKGDEELLRHTVNAMSVYSISVIPWGIFQVVIGVFQGTGHTKYNLLLSLIRLYIFRLPVVVLLSTYSNLNEYSIWYSMLISNILTAVLSIIIYMRIKKDLRLTGE
ncbi:MATE family efflux transporter [Vallitalea longa]|uniref:Probable multidrug resistance protein NorM n=1 Tax=Vallitalea longa TaxID=2936439 RepID=A0A9W5Y8Y7_9FIRM|nr:MATE family efflux transporter [Vallitalea longa]GKX29425.1 MATE family efflux transporter [Vallitalea longa]